jgi:hypothetical protein
MTFGISIRLPHSWAKHRKAKWFSSYTHGELGKYKAWEWQTDYFGWDTLFDLHIDLIPTGCDHASIGFSLTILGFMVEAKVYDSRHWDYENQTWEAYDDESMRLRMARDERDRLARLENAYELVEHDGKQKTRQSAEEFLESPQGKALIERKVKAKLEEQHNSKEAKRARGEAYRAANAAENNKDV